MPQRSPYAPKWAVFACNFPLNLLGPTGSSAGENFLTGFSKEIWDLRAPPPVKISLVISVRKSGTYGLLIQSKFP